MATVQVTFNTDTKAFHNPQELMRVFRALAHHSTGIKGCDTKAVCEALNGRVVDDINDEVIGKVEVLSDNGERGLSVTQGSLF